MKPKTKVGRRSDGKPLQLRDTAVVSHMLRLIASKALIAYPVQVLLSLALARRKQKARINRVNRVNRVLERFSKKCISKRVTRVKGVPAVRTNKHVVTGINRVNRTTEVSLFSRLCPPPRDSAGTTKQQELDSSDESWTEVRTHANALLNCEGVRIMRLEDGFAIGVWSDRDSSEIREALRIMGLSGLPIRYLDGDDVPPTYKDRDVEGEPVPMAGLGAMEQEPENPWLVRDRMLADMGWCPKGISWTKWRATLPVRSEGLGADTQTIESATLEQKVESITPNAVNAINAIAAQQSKFGFEQEMRDLEPGKAAK